MKIETSQKLNQFNLRVYGLLTDPEKQKILVCDEIRLGRKFTKFPGGGLEFGEGISDCLKREWKEETGMNIRIDALFYINDFLQVSAFKNTDQIISIYYLISSDELHKLQLKEKKFDFEYFEENAQIFRWVLLDSNLSTELDFPIDKIVAEQLFQNFSGKSAS